VTFSGNTPIPSFMKIGPAVLELKKDESKTDGQTQMCVYIMQIVQRNNLHLSLK
jgi:hypothetical protein